MIAEQGHFLLLLSSLVVVGLELKQQLSATPGIKIAVVLIAGGKGKD